MMKKYLCVEKKTNENEVIRYQYDNHLGSACLELDVEGAIISYEEYYPFGTTSYRSGRGETEVSLKRYKYCGKERDEETGLYYYGMRYYAAWLCRFVSVDPLQFEYPELTPFQYASNRPITMIDLDGLEGISFVRVDEKTGNARRIVAFNVALAKDSTGKKGYTEGELEQLKGLITSKFNSTDYTDSQGLPVSFEIGFSEFDIQNKDPYELAKEYKNDPNNPIYKYKMENPFHPDDPEQNKTIEIPIIMTIVVWRNENLKSPNNDSSYIGIQHENKAQVRYFNEIYPFGFSEIHEITHFLLSFSKLIQDEQHKLGGWMGYARVFQGSYPGEYKRDSWGKIIYDKEPDFSMSKELFNAIVNNVKGENDYETTSR